MQQVAMAVVNDPALWTARARAAIGAEALIKKYNEAEPHCQTIMGTLGNNAQQLRKDIYHAELVRKHFANCP